MHVGGSIPYTWSTFPDLTILCIMETSQRSQLWQKQSSHWKSKFKTSIILIIFSNILTAYKDRYESILSQQKLHPVCINLHFYLLWRDDRTMSLCADILKSLPDTRIQPFHHGLDLTAGPNLKELGLSRLNQASESGLPLHRLHKLPGQQRRHLRGHEGLGSHIGVDWDPRGAESHLRQHLDYGI